MTMHVVLGDGLLPGKELDALLSDMWAKANKSDDPFWFLVQGKAEPTATDTKLVQWLLANDIYYEMITDGSESDLYEKYQNKYTVKRLAPKIVSLMQETPEEGEEAHLLALFAADDPDAEEDRWLNDVIQTVTDAGYTVLAMNDGMQEIKIISSDEGEVAEVEEEAPAAPTKAAKKVAAKPAPVEEVEEEAEDLSGPYTREVLEEMDLDGLKEVAAKVGISLPPRTRMSTYIEAILGNAKDEEVEVVTVEVDYPEDGGEPVTTLQPSNTTFTTGSTANIVYTTSATSTAHTTRSPAMLIVVYNGTVVSKAITPDEAVAIMG